jgi:hypothetical protein
LPDACPDFGKQADAMIIRSFHSISKGRETRSHGTPAQVTDSTARASVPPVALVQAGTKARQQFVFGNELFFVGVTQRVAFGGNRVHPCENSFLGEMTIRCSELFNKH